MSKYKAVIFDFGRVIWHWDEVNPQIGHAKKHGVEERVIMDELKKYMHLAHDGSYSSLEDYFEKVNPDTQFTAKDLRSLLDDMDRTTWVDDKMMDYIIGLKKNFKVGLLSNFTNGLEEILKDRYNIHHHFDEVVSSYDVRMIKPNSDIYHLMLGRLGIEPEEAVFVDDLFENIEGAEAVGIKGVLHKSFEETKKELGALLK